jgi:hypothetical protein
VSIQWQNKMSEDKRKEPRQKLRYRVWIALEGVQPRGCMFSDISYSGGRIHMDDTTAIPEKFTLLLTSNGSIRRQCRAVWRNPQQIGITFEPDITADEQSKLVPALNANNNSRPDDAEPPTESIKPV